ncbi:MAG: BglII/BstYI family type II restriction endonuclease [Dehalococcoidia bacterium]
MFGESVLDNLYPDVKREVLSILTNTPILAASKVSEEKTRKGRVVWSGKDFNEPLELAFRRQGWEKRRFYYPGQSRYYIDVDFCKGRASVEVQFGKYSFVQHDFSKFRYLFEEADEPKRIDVGIEVIACAGLQRLMYTGPANFESVVASMKAHARNDPPVPIWVLAIDVV